MQEVPNSVIVACDGMTVSETFWIAQKLHGKPGFAGLKFTDLLDGIQIGTLNILRQFGLVMVDQKIHDIPDTAQRRVSKWLEYADFITVHTLGGFEMMWAATKAAHGSTTKIVGVTLLTSHTVDDLDRIGIQTHGTHAGPPILERVLHLVEEAKRGNVFDFVCSPQEVAAVRARLFDGSGGAHIPMGTLITPGIRLGTQHHEQKRTGTPGIAIAQGADYIVAGRELTKAENPVAMLANYIEDIRRETDGIMRWNKENHTW